MCAVTASVFGAGFQLYDEASTEGLALGGAVSARQDVISNAWYNPASTTQFKERQLMFGGTLVQLATEYNDTPASGAAQDASLRRHWQAIPHMFFINPLPESTRTTVGFSLTAPYGLSSEWDWAHNTVGPTISNEINLKTLYLSPFVAVKATDRLSLAAGINLVYADVYFRNHLPMIPPYGLGGQKMILSADTWGLGGFVGANYQVHKDWSLALKYQGPVDLHFDDGTVRYEATQPALASANRDQIEADVTLPPTVTLGVATTAVPKWTFGFDVVWTHWSEYDQFRVDFEDSPYPPANTNKPLLSVKNWKNTFAYHLSAEYKLAEEWKLRFGYVYDQTPTRDEFRSPELPDSNRHMFSTGVGYDHKTWGVDLGYCFLLLDEASSQQSTAFGGNLQGEYYDGYAHLLASSVWFKF